MDGSLSGDRTGIAVTHIDDYIPVRFGHVYLPREEEIKSVENWEFPVYFVDGVLAITPKGSEHINLNLIDALIVELARILNIRYATADWLDLEFALQHWQQQGIRTSKFSVDKTPAAYYEIRHAIRDERILWPPHEILDREARQVERHTKGGRVIVDHPHKGTKDCLDAVAATCRVLSHVEAQVHTLSKARSSKAEDMECQKFGTVKRQRVRRGLRGMVRTLAR